MRIPIYLMPNLVRKIDFSEAPSASVPQLLHREWLVTNGLGGYASGTISGAVTWRYHGLLIAALPSPMGRVVMFNHLAEFLRLPGGRGIQLCGDDSAQCEFLAEFRLENQMPIWRYEIDGVVLEKI